VAEEMNRRGFLRGLLGTGAALALDPEKMLWVPGKRLISIPAGPRLLTIDMITYETLAFLQRNTIAMHRVRDYYDHKFIDVRRPRRFVA